MKAQSQSTKQSVGFHRWHLKAKTCGLLAGRQGYALETLNRMSKKADRGEWNEEKGIFERQLETGPSVAVYSGTDRAGHVFFFRSRQS